MKVQALVFVLLLLPGEAIAADKELADKLTATIRYEDVMDSVLHDCIDKARATDVAALVSESPDLLGGIAPDSPLWPAARKAYLNMAIMSCQTFSKEKATAAVTRVLSEQLTNAEIKEILAFYDTPAGKRFIFATALANSVANRESVDDAAAKRVGDSYTAEIVPLIKEHLRLIQTPASDDSK